MIEIKKYIIFVFYFFQAIFFKRDFRCPYCNNRRFKVVFKKRIFIDICQCQQCGLFWTNPIFKLWNLYDLFYETHNLTTKVIKGKALEGALANRFKGTEKDSSFIVNWIIENSNGRKLLEFGSSWGYFLYQAQCAGFNVTGVEISKRRRDFGIKFLKVDIVPSLDALIYRKEKFDVIFTFHVLEHLVYIGDIFYKFRALLNDEGILVIDVPYVAIKNREKNFSQIGAIHPLGFSEDFFLYSLSREGFQVDICQAYNKFSQEYHWQPIVVCKKKKP